MIKYINKHKLLVIFELIVATLRATSSVILSFAMGHMTNSAVSHDAKQLLYSVLICVLSLIFLYILYVIEMHCRKNLSGMCLIDLKKDTYNSLVKLGVYKFHKENDSFYINLLQNDIEILEKDYFDSLWRLLNLLVQILFCVIALMKVSIKLCFVFFVVSIFPQIISRIFKNKLSDIKNEYSLQNSKCIQKVKEFILGYDTIMHFSKWDEFIQRGINEDIILENKRINKDVESIKISYGINSLNMIAQIICMSVAAYYVAIGELKFGSLTTSTQLLNYTFTPLNAVVNCVLSILSTKKIRDKFENLKSSEKQTGSFNNGDIKLANITVFYDTNKILDNFSYIFEKNKHYAIIGNSGVGKSTLAKAIIGDICINSGSIYIDNVNINQISNDDLYKNILYVSQNSFLFEGTVLENINFFSNNKIDDEYISLLSKNILYEQAGGDDGMKISTGEIARISFIRALESKAPIMIFDEPTFGLDPVMASKVENIIQNIKNRTIIVITHNWNGEYLSAFDGVIELKTNNINI